MPINAGGLLLYSLLDLRHRYLRYIGGLSELRGGLDPGELRFLEAAKQEMVEDLQAFEQDLRGLLVALSNTFDLTDPGTWSLPARQAVADLARSHFQAFDNRQQELFPFLPLGPRPPADVAFFLARVYGMSATRPSHRKRFSLTYGRFTAWEGRGFTSETEAVAVLPMPFSEALTPLRWPLLAHELAHWFKPGGEPMEPQVQEIVQEAFGPGVPAATADLFDEILSDAAAYQACGMAYAFALAIEAQLLTGQAHTATVLGFGQRLALLSGRAQELAESLPGEWQADVPGLDTVPEAEQCRSAAEAILGSLHPPATRPKVVANVRSLLRDRQPASGLHLWPVQDMTDVAAIRGDVMLRESVGLSAVDLAATDQELLEAAWLEELDREPASIVATLRESLLTEEGQLDPDATEEAVGMLAKSDTAVSRSLQAAAVHQWLLTWDVAISNRTAQLGIAASGDEHPAEGAADSDPALPDDGVESSPLSDLQLVRRIRHSAHDRQLVVRPLIDPAQIGGTTIDLRLGTEWEVLRTSRFQALDPGADPVHIETLLDASVEEFRLTAGLGQDLILHPGELLLALTLEYLRLPDDLWGVLEGRSTWARLGLQVHATAGMVDCGFEGYLTLELQNTGHLPLVLTPGLRVAQMAFFPVAEVINAYHRRPTAAYSEQTRARSAFPAQHEHRALYRYLSAEAAADTATPAAKGDDD